MIIFKLILAGFRVERFDLGKMICYAQERAFFFFFFFKFIGKMVFLTLNYVPPKKKSYTSHMLSIFV